MGRRAHNIGLILAILGGVLAVNNAIWPIAPQSYAPPHLAAIWAILSFAVGVAFLVAAFLSEYHVGAARVLLFVGGVLLICSGIYFGASQGILAAAFDLIPGVCGIAAGFLIGPTYEPIPPFME